MNKEREFEVALSFAGENREYVDRVANLLRDAGVRVFYDLFEEANLWGKNLYDYLSDIYMNKALYTIMFISEPYSRKLWPDHERQSMQAKAFQESQEYILPARFDETPIPGVLPTVGYIYLVNKKPEEFVEIVLKKLVNSGATIPSASVRRSLFATSTQPRANPSTSTIQIESSEGRPIPDTSVLAIADNNTTKAGRTNDAGVAEITIHTRRAYKLLVAHAEFPGALIETWDPADDISVILAATTNTGSVVCRSTCHIPGLTGRLNPILDSHDRMYLYADNIAINGGETQPVCFVVNEPFELEDCDGVVMQLTILHIQGDTSLIQFVHPSYDS